LPSASLVVVHAGEFAPGVADNAVKRDLVKADLQSADVLDHHDAYCADTHVRHFHHAFTLAYITPWNSHGYDVAKKFALKFTHISPVWFQVKLESVTGSDGKSKIKVRIEGGHDADANWIRDVQEAGANHATKTRVAIVPRFIVEPSSADLYVKLAQRPGLQKLVISKIQQAIAQHQLDGMVLEMTDAWAVVAQSSTPKVRNDLNAFVMKLGSALHSTKDAPKQLILVVRPLMRSSPYFQAFDFQAVYKFVDGFSLMVSEQRWSSLLRSSH
jgi:chitinase domain-containing protein 1